ncbi:DUF819 family protein [Sphingobacteriaceae bacterium WQ 2009]|uniref:DUF819 family protein n=1 Tax=Rhinopithecimicrobium faecis TaxID=2820698 RepID=A0A8T4HCE8_9SPHI|nr:DUF819 family protein [Sphingobacteriaceae bacterium WQ 2009]
MPITDTVVVFALLMSLLGVVFYASNLENPLLKKFFAVFPPLLLCYFVPGMMNTMGLIDGNDSPLPSIGSRYLLPACLILFTINLNMKEMWALRKKAGVMFLAGTLGVLVGGPIAVWIVAQMAPHIVGGEGADEVWRGLGTVAGSWIGGSANQVALREILQPSPKLFSAMIAVDVFVAYGWMALLLWGAGRNKKMDAIFKADSKDVDELMVRMEQREKANARTPEVKDYIYMLAIAFGATGLAHFCAGPIADWFSQHMPEMERFSLTSKFFWIIFFATAFGICLSFTSARKFEYVGSSKLGSLFLYILITTIGMQMDVFAILENPGLFIVGFIWILIHATIMFIVGKWIKAPFFFYSVGSLSNIGGVASASVMAAAFHPSLISIGVILSVFGYAIGTYGGWLCAVLMQLVSP